MTSTVFLLVAVVCYKMGMSPPNPTPDDSRVDSGVGRLIPLKVAIPMSVSINYLIVIHFALEIYALWEASGLLPFNLQTTCISGVYTAQGIPPLATMPLSLIVLGGLTRSSCHNQLGKMFTWDTSILKDHKLITNGLYRFVRHPAYTGCLVAHVGYFWFLVMPGTFARECLIGPHLPFVHGLPSDAKSIFGALYALSYFLLNIDTVIFLARRSFAEDKMLKKEFGKEWDEWARRVRWNVVPYIL